MREPKLAKAMERLGPGFVLFRVVLTRALMMKQALLLASVASTLVGFLIHLADEEALEEEAALLNATTLP